MKTGIYRLIAFNFGQVTKLDGMSKERRPDSVLNPPAWRRGLRYELLTKSIIEYRLIFILRIQNKEVCHLK